MHLITKCLLAVALENVIQAHKLHQSNDQLPQIGAIGLTVYSYIKEIPVVEFEND